MFWPAGLVGSPEPTKSYHDLSETVSHASKAASAEVLTLEVR